MKYLKMIAMPFLMIAVAMFILWGMVASTGFVQMLWVVLMIASMVGLCAWDFIGLKSLADIIVAVVALVVVGAGLKYLFFTVLGWPWIAMGQVNQDTGLMSFVSRLWTPLLNWWALGGVVIGALVSAGVLIWLQRTKQF